ncbi:MAG: TRAP transporter substrate-binding protein [Spirochaetales bacterium]|nr:TRAP transporter substrate-binding protein [Spirochaetales bacterium]
MRKMLLFVVIIMVAGLAPTLFATGAEESDSAEQDPIVLKFAHVLQTDHPYHLMALKFEEELEQADPRVDVQIFPAGQLGNERELIEALQLGTVDVSTITSSVTANFVPGFKVFSLPFIFRDADHLFSVMDSPIGDRMAEELESVNLIKLGYAYGGSRDLYGSVPMTNLEELRGRKVRTMENAILIDAWNTLGAIATPIPWGEVYVSLKQEVVDGGEGTGVSFRSMKFYDVATYYSRINYVFSWHNFMMSGNTWNEFDAELQAKIMDAAEIAQDYERAVFVEQEAALFDELSSQYGVQVVIPEDIDLWREQVLPVYEKNADEVGGMDLIREIMSY